MSETPDGSGQLHAEDLTPGYQFWGEPIVLSPEHFSTFAALTGDAHPLHYDEAYAAQTRFKRPVAHGLLLMAMTALGATAMSRRLEAAMVAFVDQGARFLRPAFAGDRLRVQFTVTAVEPTPGGSAAMVRLAVRLVGDAGEAVLEGHHRYLIRSRAGGAAARAGRRAEP